MLYSMNASAEPSNDLGSRIIDDIFQDVDRDIISTDLEYHLELGSSYRFFYERGKISLDEEGGTSSIYGDFKNTNTAFYSPVEKSVFSLEELPNPGRFLLAREIKALFLQSLETENQNTHEFGIMPEDPDSVLNPSQAKFVFIFDYGADNSGDLFGEGSVFFRVNLRNGAVNALWYEHYFSNIRLNEWGSSFRETKEPKSVKYYLSRDLRDKLRSILQDFETEPEPNDADNPVNSPENSKNHTDD